MSPCDVRSTHKEEREKKKKGMRHQTAMFFSCFLSCSPKDDEGESSF